MQGKATFYSKGAKVFHWLIAAIVIGMLAGSFFLGNVPERYQPSAYMIHKSLGLTVLFLIVAGFFWIKYTGKPVLPHNIPTWQKLLARTVQYSLYVLLVCMPLSGWIMSVAGGRIPTYFGLFSMPLPIKASKALSQLMNQSHKTIAWILITLVVLHISGALKHHFINKNNVLREMLPRPKL